MSALDFDGVPRRRDEPERERAEVRPRRSVLRELAWEHDELVELDDGRWFADKQPGRWHT